jgi:glycosyltransferase involved in cell wall biosynthesis
MSRLVFATQRIDPTDPAVGAATAKVRALADRVDEVVVLADGAAPGSLPPNVRVRAFAAASRLGRGARFEAALAAEFARGRPIAVLAHMSPIYAVLAAPLARPLGVPVLLWFTQWRDSRLLRLGERVSSVVLTVDRTTFPFSSPKVVATGHGVDVAFFRCAPAPVPSGDELRLVALGRYSPTKGLPAIVRAVRVAQDAGADVRLDVHGPLLLPADAGERLAVEALADELGLDGSIGFHGPLAYDEVPGALARADALVNNTRHGGADKVVFEAAAACRPVLAGGPAFVGLLPESLRFPGDDVDALAACIVELARLTPDRRAELGRELRARVEVNHSVEHWAEAVLAAAGP